MILTANDFVNVRLGRPSVNAENPAFLSPGKTVNAKARVIGDTVNHNSRWILTEENEFLSEEGFVRSRELSDMPISIANTSNSPLFNALKIPELWKISMGEDVKIGIIDNGVHIPSLGNIVKHMNDHPPLDAVGHGTTMACIIGSLDESNGKIGVAPKVSGIYSYFINIKENSCEINAKQLLSALDEMDREGIKIINMSFTCRTPTFMLTRKEGVELQQKIDLLSKKGCLLVAACGNDGLRLPKAFPASYRNVIAVTGHNISGSALNEDSSFWEGSSVALPVSSYFLGSRKENSQGTSGAAAIFSGILACTYHSLGADKYTTIISAINKCAPISDELLQFRIPKFNTDNFLHNLNLSV